MLRPGYNVIPGAAIVTRLDDSLAVQRNLEDRLADHVCVLDYDGVAADDQTDCTDGIQVAMGSGNRRLYFPPGTYAIKTGGGPLIRVSDLHFDFAPGAILKTYQTGAAITIGRYTSDVIRRIRITGGRIITAVTDTTVATNGIQIAPDAGNVVRELTIDGTIIDGMSQYGIVGKGELSDITIKNVLILNNGSNIGNWTSQALIFFPSVADGVSDRLTIENVFAQQVGAYTGQDSHACKIQRFNNVCVNNCYFYGGGSATVTGYALGFDDNTNVRATNLRCYNVSSAGLMVQSNDGSMHEIIGVEIDGTSSYSVYLGSSGGDEISLRAVHAVKPIGCDAGTYNRIEIRDCIVDDGIDFSNASCSVTNSVIQGNTVRKRIYVKGDSNIIRDNNVLSSSTYAVAVKGDSNWIDGNYAGSPTTGHVQIISGTSNVIGTLKGTGANGLVYTDGGTTTVIGNIGTYAGGNPGDLTPTVLGVSYMLVANSGATTITNLDNGTEGQIVTLTFADSNTTIASAGAGGNFRLAGGVDYTSTSYDTITFVFSATIWREISRSVNI